VTKQPADNPNATADEERAAKQRVIPEPLMTEEEEAEAYRLACEAPTEEARDRLQAFALVRARKIAKTMLDEVESD
jgi:hypothetical protein